MRLKHDNNIDLDKYEFNVENETGSISNIPQDIDELYLNNNYEYINNNDQNVPNSIAIQEHNLEQNSEDTINCI